MTKHIVTAALFIELSALSLIAVFLISTLVGQPTLDFA